MFGTENPGTGSYRDPATGKMLDDMKPVIESIGSLTQKDRDNIFGDGYTILRLGKCGEDMDGLKSAIQSFGAPVDTLDIPDRLAREIYGADLLLLRPDMHVVWRGNKAPEDPLVIAAVATGH